jgi:hypothetical protein
VGCNTGHSPLSRILQKPTYTKDINKVKAPPKNSRGVLYLFQLTVSWHRQTETALCVFYPLSEQLPIDDTGQEVSVNFTSALPPRTEESWIDVRAESVRFLRPNFLEADDVLNISSLVLPPLR